MTDYSHFVISGGGLYGVCMLGVLRYLYIENKERHIIVKDSIEHLIYYS